MDGTRFDALARALATSGSRRSAIRAAIAAAAASLLGGATAEAWPHAGRPCNEDGTCPLGQQCLNGFCVCQGGMTICGGHCANLATDPFNCGACGNHCQPGVACVDGECECNGEGSCGGKCCPSPYFCDLADNQCKSNCPRDQRPCGMFQFNRPICCPPGEACLDPREPKCGKCPEDAVVCNQGRLLHPKGDCCHGTCCNEVCCETGKLCCGGATCCDATRGFVCDGIACACKKDFSLCGEGDLSYCADLQNDPRNCGACSHACADGDACIHGVCCSAKRACHDRCCPPLQECCDDGTCKFQGTCCPKARQCKGGCCPAGQKCCDGACKPADKPCPCTAERDCSDAGLGCCNPGTYCAVDYDTSPICCPSKPCGDENYCCDEGDICRDGQCCGAKSVTSDGQCCGVASMKKLACGVNCCDTTHQVCIGDECCDKTQVSSGGECCHFNMCHGQCCAADENCFGFGGGPEKCAKYTPVEGG